jgi:hypothetical protein
VKQRVATSLQPAAESAEYAQPAYLRLLKPLATLEARPRSPIGHSSTATDKFNLNPMK